MAKGRICLTGIKPTGTPHIGNYLGAIKPALKLVERAERTLYFIADYHALTSVQDRAEMNRLVYEVAATWLALGLDPNRCIFYRQSDIPEVFELAWALSCLTAKGLMNRAHAYKAAVAKNEESGVSDPDAGINMGIYGYPILMAADILLFDADTVPVGKDQGQHLEIARDIAQHFNHTFGDTLTLPNVLTEEAVAAIPGLDGRKMSKSYDNTIPIFVPAPQLKKLVMRFVTDSSAPTDPKDPDTSTLFAIYKLVASAEKVEAMRARYRAGVGWGDVKKELFEALDETLREPREKYNALLADRAQIDALLEKGAAEARKIAVPVLQRVRKAIGIRV
jgi:tryptophanyl-tRNA synthetase